MWQRLGGASMRSSQFSLLDGALAAAVIAGVLLTSVALLLQPTGIDLAGVRVSLRNPARPFVVSAGVMLLWAWLNPRRSDQLTHLASGALRRIPPWLAALLLALIVVVTGIRTGSTVASAADSYGYITQAEMLAQGHVRRPELPLAAVATWPESRASLTPLGWVPAEPGVQVPVYPPGYPLLMAVARSVDARLMRLVVPVAGAVTLSAMLWMAALVGRRDLGWAAVVLLGTSPAFLMSLVVPMSDLPATAAWTVAATAVLAPGAWAALLGGLAGALGVLIRPNLLPLSLAVIALAASAGQTSTPIRVWRATLTAAALSTGALAVAAFQWAYYGSPIANGYGPLQDLFARRYWPTNIAQFSVWLESTHAPFALAGVGGALIARVRGAHHVPWWLLPVPGVTLACYLFYMPFDNWTYLRFLLPGLPILMLWSAAGLRWLTQLTPATTRPLAFVLLVLWCGLVQFHEARVRHVFANAASVQRFETVSRQVQQRVPLSSIVIAREFSGSLQYYGGLQTLRWDRLDASALEQAVSHLQALDRPVFALLDERSEVPDFKARFPAALQARLEAVETFEGTAERITLYRWRPSSE